MTTLFTFLAGSVLACAAIWIRSRYLDFLAQKPEDYSDANTEFDVRKHLNGPIICEGVIFGPMGRVTSRFVGEFNAEWDGNVGIMTEHFKYSSGETQDRRWDLTLLENGEIRAEAADLVGTGKGKQRGSGCQLTYTIRLPESAGGHVLNVPDWMYLVDNGTIVNRSQFRKFGIKVAELVATMRPADAGEEAAKEAA